MANPRLEKLASVLVNYSLKIRPGDKLSMPESGGVNDSALHWDLVCDLHEGKVYADGELCYENGRFLI